MIRPIINDLNFVLAAVLGAALLGQRLAQAAQKLADPMSAQQQTQPPLLCSIVALFHGKHLTRKGKSYGGYTSLYGVRSRGQGPRTQFLLACRWAWYLQPAVVLLPGHDLAACLPGTFF